MKLDINDLTNGLAKSQNIIPEIEPIESTTDFMTGFVQNVKQVMDVLDAVGVKDLFVQKAREELEGRLFGRGMGNPMRNSNQQEETQMIRNPLKFDIEKGISLALVWLDKFIEKNGDIPLSEFRKHIENQRQEIVNMIKGLGIGV